MCAEAACLDVIGGIVSVGVLCGLWAGVSVFLFAGSAISDLGHTWPNRQYVFATPRGCPLIFNMYQDRFCRERGFNFKLMKGCINLHTLLQSPGRCC